MTYDLIILYGQPDLLSLRLHQHSFVDKFVIVETHRDFQNQRKELVFDDSRFRKFADKIHYTTIKSWPDDAFTPHDKADYWRNVCRDELKKLGVKDSDTVIFTDPDEILSERTFNKYKGGLSHPRFTNYMYYLNVRRDHWTAGFISDYGFMKDKDMTTLRYNYHRRQYDCKVLHDAGWHFSWLGGREVLQDKYRNFKGVEQWPPDFEDDEWVDNLLANRIDFVNGKVLPVVGINKNFPKHLQDNRYKFKEYIYRKPKTKKK